MAKSRKELIDYLAQVEKQLYNLYGNTYRQALEISEVRQAIEAGASFTWKGNPQAEKKLNQYLKDLTNKAGVVVGNGVQQGYAQGEQDAQPPIVEKLGTTEERRTAIQEICTQATQERRAQGMTAHAYATAKRGGLTISNRVWNINNNAKQELEVMIQNGILEGKGAKEIASQLKGYLNNPNALYRRVRNKETGNLELSEAAKQYNPGRGVYRSAYKNALRLVRTEMNAAYRRAEWESYQNNPLVTSYEIRLSNNHTTLNRKGQRVALKDICDDMAGIYPKTFLWTGWHPQCRCVMIPIVVQPKDFSEYLKARRAKRLEEYNPQNKTSQPIAEVPKQLTKWTQTNQKRLQEAPQKPYFIEQNKGLIEASEKLKLFAGTFQSFVEQLTRTGRSIGQQKQIGRIDDKVREDMQAKGQALQVETILVLDRTVLKYIGHPKTAKGANLPAEQYSQIEAAINTPKHIYQDLNSKELVYVYTHPHEAGKVVKVVVHPNYKYKGVTTNVAKSWGVVKETEMDNPQYRKIK